MPKCIAAIPHVPNPAYTFHCISPGSIGQEGIRGELGTRLCDNEKSEMVETGDSHPAPRLTSCDNSAMNGMSNQISKFLKSVPIAPCPSVLRVQDMDDFPRPCKEAARPLTLHPPPSAPSGRRVRRGGGGRPGGLAGSEKIILGGFRRLAVFFPAGPCRSRRRPKDALENKGTTLSSDRV